MSNQLPIVFNEPNARKIDPVTSHAAAVDASFRASKHRMLALKTLHKFGPLTDYELAYRTGLQQNSVGKRRKDCQDAGLVDFFMNDIGEKVKRPAPSGSKALVWKITDAGISYLMQNDIEE
jgi:DNA-binding transcriptional ArsR family regulator